VGQYSSRPPTARDRLAVLWLRQVPNWVASRPPCSLSFEIFLDALLRGAKSASEGNFCEIVAVETGDVLFMGAGDGLLRLHDFDCIGDAGRETIARLEQRLFR